MKFDNNNNYGVKSSRKGVPNKATSELRNRVKMIIEDNVERLQSDLDNVEPKERLNFLIQLLNFALPKLKAMEITDDRAAANDFKTIYINTNEDETTKNWGHKRLVKFYRWILRYKTSGYRFQGSWGFLNTKIIIFEDEPKESFRTKVESFYNYCLTSGRIPPFLIRNPNDEFEIGQLFEAYY